MKPTDDLVMKAFQAGLRLGLETALEASEAERQDMLEQIERIKHGESDRR